MPSNLDDWPIFEGVVSTMNEDGSAHIKPLGFRCKGALMVLRPFEPSKTLRNLEREGSAVMNFTDDVRVTAGTLTGHRVWPVAPTLAIAGWRLVDSLRHLELAVEDIIADEQRPSFVCRVVKAVSHRPFQGFNRAQAAVIEAAILVSRLDFIATNKLAVELQYLFIAVSKTAGWRERVAWSWLMDAVRSHPRHQLDLEFQT